MSEHSLNILRADSESEAVYIKTHMQVVGRSTVKGFITKEQFAKALYYLEKKYPILCSVANEEALIKRSAESHEIVEWIYDSTPEKIYEKLLNLSLDFCSSLYSMHVLVGENSFDIFTVTAHAITDATSIMMIHKDLIYFCECSIREITPEIIVQPVADSIDSAVDTSINTLKNNHPVSQSYSGDFLQLPSTSAEALFYCLKQIVIEEKTLAQAFQLCEEHQVSLHGVLVAAFSLAIQRLSHVKATQILMRSSIDLRRRVSPHIPNELILTAVTGHITHITNLTNNIFKIAKFVIDEIRNSTQDGTIFQDYKQYPQRFTLPQAFPIAANLSDMGKVDLLHLESLEQTGFEYAAGWKKTCPNISITIYNNKLIANLVYIKHSINSDLIQQLGELVIEIMTRLK